MCVDLSFNYDEATKSMEKFCQNDIEELRNWTIKLDKCKSVPKNLSDKQLVLFYNACCGDMDKTKTCIEMYYECRENAPEFFSNRIWNTDLTKASEVLEIFHIPGKSCEGYDIIYFRLKDTDASKFNIKNTAKLLFMIIDECLTRRGPFPGYIIIFDMKGAGLRHLTKFNLSTIKKVLLNLQAIPVRLRAIHILNTEPLMNILVSLLRPFVNPDLFNMSKFHSKNESIEMFYEVVPKCSFPSNYGGTLPDTETLHKNSLEQLKLKAAYFEAEEEQRLAAQSDKTERGNV